MIYLLTDCLISGLNRQKLFAQVTMIYIIIILQCYKENRLKSFIIVKYVVQATYFTMIKLFLISLKKHLTLLKVYGKIAYVAHEKTLI